MQKQIESEIILSAREIAIYSIKYVIKFLM